jgi:hypothetical protein
MVDLEKLRNLLETAVIQLEDSVGMGVDIDWPLSNVQEALSMVEAELSEPDPSQMELDFPDDEEAIPLNYELESEEDDDL